MNNLGQKLTLFCITLFVLIIWLSCSTKPTDISGEFDVYGRMVYRPLIAGSSSADFYIFHKNEPVKDALILVANDTVPLVDTANGFYSRDMQVVIGESLYYSINSQYGTLQGAVVIPDTVSIIKPALYDSLITQSDMLAIWRRNSLSDGYYAYLERQEGFVAAITESQYDTTVELSRDNIIRFGLDRFWVENLNGYFSSVIAPSGRNMPKGVVGAAGNFRDIYVVLP